MSIRINGTNTAANPGITGADTDTGLSFGTDEVSLNTAGTERFRVGSAGQFGIGGATYGTSGQVLTSGGASAAPSWTTPDAGLSYTSSVVDITSSVGTTFTSIPNKVRQIRISFQDVNFTDGGNVKFRCQLGDSGGLESTGYTFNSTYHGLGTGQFNTVNENGFTSGNFDNTSATYTGYYLITRLTDQASTSNIIYICNSGFEVQSAGYNVVLNGFKQLSGEIDRIFFGSVNGTSTFESGVVRIDYLS